MMYGYARCSIKEGSQDVENQRRKLKKLGVNESEIFLDCEYKRTVEDAQLDRLLSSVCEGDTIVVTEVSRLTLSVRRLCEIIEFVREMRLELIIGTVRIDCRKSPDPMTDGMLTMAGVFADLDYKIAAQRIKAGMETAKLEGKKAGRPATTMDNLPVVFLRNYPRYERGELTQEGLAKKCGVTRQTISKYIKILKQIEDSILKHEIDKDIESAKAEYMRELNRLRNIKNWTNEELKAEAKNEETDVEQDGISDFTPATKELRRRQRKLEKKLAERERRESMVSGIEESDDMQIEPFEFESTDTTLDLSEFDV